MFEKRENSFPRAHLLHFPVILGTIALVESLALTPVFAQGARSAPVQSAVSVSGLVNPTETEQISARLAQQEATATTVPGDTNVVADTSPPVEFVNQDDGWRISGILPSPLATQAFSIRSYAGQVWPGTTIEVTTNGGVSWATQDTVSSGVWGIQFESPTNGWAIGVSQLLGTTDGGETWDTLAEPPAPLASVDFSSPLDGMGVTIKGSVYTTTDGGQSWTLWPTASSMRAVCTTQQGVLALTTAGQIDLASAPGTQLSQQFSIANLVPGLPQGAPTTAQLVCEGDNAWASFVINFAPQGAGENYLIMSSTNGGVTWAASASRSNGLLPGMPDSTSPGLLPELGWLELGPSGTASAVENDLLTGTVGLISVPAGAQMVTSNQLPALGALAQLSVGPSFSVQLATAGSSTVLAAPVSGMFGTNNSISAFSSMTASAQQAARATYTDKVYLVPSAGPPAQLIYQSPALSSEPVAMPADVSTGNTLTAPASTTTPATASTSYVCSSQWCSGTDGSWGKNQQANPPQIYTGQVGDAFTDFFNDAGVCGSVNGDNYKGSCYNNWSGSTSGALGAVSRFDAGTGAGTFAYYTVAGPSDLPSSVTIVNSNYGTYWNYGADQFIQAWDDTVGVPPAGSSYEYINSLLFYVFFADMESGDNFSQSTPAANRNIFDGFFQEAETYADAQPGAYAGASFWNSYFGGTGSIAGTPIYMATYEECDNTTVGCPNSDAQWPTNGFGDFTDTITGVTVSAASFGNSAYPWFWQFFESNCSSTNCPNGTGGADYDSGQLTTMYAPQWGHDVD